VICGNSLGFPCDSLRCKQLMVCPHGLDNVKKPNFYRSEDWW
jgi:hypothetical protein